ncbi:acetylcholinesterase-like [Lutzomyia longipalpis]|uniref:acetylcholinesterase-like n=1 Tax=Lutzomyia longipalpis TaxID=7200 RepID=UPI0024838FA1|nr:acetylcholinesterase-like [Lutzomyia longipalpis]
MLCKRVILLGIFVFNLCALGASDECEVTLQQGYGEVHGYGLQRTTPKGDPYCSFLSIPYVRPPVGALRFEPPQPLDLSRYAPTSWYFRYKSPICVQNRIFANETGQEDCLYLNVYTKPSTTDQPKAVIVWLHGGWGTFGSAYSDGADRVGYLMDEDVVVVTLNYRLGVLGFFYRRNDNFVANLGLLDQLEALKWVQGNIASFGGDPKKVTLMGWSAGGVDVGYHLQSPAFRGLFHRAIMLSGSPLVPWAYERSTEACTKMLCRTLDIPCFRGKLKDLLKRLPGSIFGSQHLNYRTSISYFGVLHPCFVPTYEGKFEESPTVQDEQLKLIYHPVENDVPLMIGYTVAEDYPYYYLTQDHLANTWNYSFVNTSEEVIRPLRRYLQIGTKELNNFSARLMVPASMVHGIKEFTNYYSYNAYSNVYFYRFSHKNDSNWFGALHGDDLRFIFGPHDTPTTQTDDLVRMRMVRYVTDFAKVGNPTPKLDEIIRTRWTPYAHSALRMEISEESKMVRDVKDVTYKRWETIYQCLEYNDCKKFFKLTSER